MMVKHLHVFLAHAEHFSLKGWTPKSRQRCFYSTYTKKDNPFEADATSGCDYTFPCNTCRTSRRHKADVAACRLADPTSKCYRVDAGLNPFATGPTLPEYHRDRP